jgi:hypothetical protein
MKQKKVFKTEAVNEAVMTKGSDSDCRKLQKILDLKHQKMLKFPKKNSFKNPTEKRS